MVDATQVRGATLDVIHVSQGFRTPSGPLPVLEDVSLSAKAGEFIALVGPSGCGKSTLLRLLAGLDRPLFGQLYVDGSSITGPSPSRGFVFQDPTLLPWHTVRSNVALGPEARGRLAQSRDAVEDALRLVGLEEFADALPSQLSGGMAQRVSLARVLVNRPRVVLFDEPLGKLDALTRSALQRQILGLWQQERFTGVLVTHDVDEAILLADRIVVFSARPARILEVVSVGHPHPRDLADAWFLQTRRHILDLLEPQLAS